MSDPKNKPSIDVNKFLEVQSKELDVRNKEIDNRNIESHNQKEIRLKEIDKSVEVEQIEKEKMQIFFNADEKQNQRKFILILIGIGIGIGLVVFSCFLLYEDHKYGSTIFFSTISFIAGIFSGIGFKKSYERDIPSE